MFIVYLYFKGNMVGHTKFKSMEDAENYADEKKALGYKVLVVNKTK